MNRLGFSIGIAALLLVSTVAADVVWTNLPGFGDRLQVTDQPGVFRYEVDINGNGVWEVAFEGDGIEFSAVVNEHALIQTIPETPPNLGSDAWSLQLGDTVGPNAYAPTLWHRDTKGRATMRICLNIGCAGYWPEGSEVKYDPEEGLPVILPDSGYLAVAFTNMTELHYGWIDVGVLGFSATGVIYGWGWETEAETPVTIVPEPGSVGLLLLFAGLAALRRAKRTPCYSRESLSER
jgi:hypothetical protein